MSTKTPRRKGLDHKEGLLSAYIPVDRRLALLRGEELPQQADGAVLVADIGGFTALGEDLARRLGPEHGAEELNRQVSACFADLIAAVHSYRGSVVRFSGDALLASFSGESDPLARATAAAYAVQQAMGGHPSLSLRVGVGTGAVRRRLVGDPAYGVFDLLSGPALRVALAALQQAGPGEIAGTLAPAPARPCPWPVSSWEDLPAEALRAWVPAEIYGRLAGGAAAFVAELRQVLPLFLQVDCPEEDLAACVAVVQAILASCEAHLNGVEILDKGTVLVAFFGAPVAHGDDPLRAMRAALALREAGRKGGRLPSLRIGLSMGPLYAGLVGSSERLAYTVYGDEMNVAARLMAAAGPGEVLANARVRRATESRYRFTALPALLVKGRTDPVSVDRLEEEREVALPAARSPLVGRQHELAHLDAVMEQAWAGRGRVVVLRGEAGIGKSRLAAALLQRWQDRGGQAYVGQTQATSQQRPYLAWGELLHALFHLTRDDQDVPLLEKSVAALNPALLPRLPLLGDILGLPIADNTLTRSFDARLRQASTQALVVDLLRAQEGPLLLLLEDVQWLDGLSWDLTLAVARGLAGRPTLLGLTSRPLEPLPTALAELATLPSYEAIDLAGFAPAEAVELACARLGGSSLPGELAEFLQARGQGNPFFIEELLHALVEEGFLRREGTEVHLQRPLAEARLPGNVQGVVLARLDRLDEPARLTLKVAAVIGRVFAYPVLREVHPIHAGQDPALHEQLAHLQDLDVIVVEVPAPEPDYVFRHAITHEVAYGTLLFSQRRELHGRIARYYEQHHRDYLEPYYALLAYHYGRSGDEERQAYYDEQAGQEAARRYANVEAISFYSQALEILGRRAAALRGEPLEENRLRRWELLRRRTILLNTVGQREEQRVNLERSLALAKEIGRPDLVLQNLQQWASFFHITGEYDRAQATLEQVLQMARENRSHRMEGSALRLLGRIAGDRGHPRESLGYYDGALNIFRAAGIEREVADTLNLLGLAHHSLGEYDQARPYFEQALDLCRRAGDYRGEAQSLGNIGLVYWDCGQYDRALEQFHQSLQMGRQMGIRQYEALNLNNIGDLYRYKGQYDQAVEYLEQAIHAAVEISVPSLKGESLNNLGRVYLEQGDLPQARGCLEQALEIRTSLGETGSIVLDLSFLGRALLGLGEREQALEHSRRAMELLQAEGVAVDWRHQVHYNHSLVCRALGLAEEATAALERAYRAMQDLAEAMGEEGRRAFLENVRVNREIIVVWAGQAPQKSAENPAG